MIGLIFLVVGLIWLWFVGYLAVKIPRWFEMRSAATWWARLLLPPFLIIGPFVDEIVGMKQFERLCSARAVVWTSPNAEKVAKAVEEPTKYENLSGYWIPVQSRKISFLDADTGEPFMSYEMFGTKGGRIARFALLGGEHQCSPPSPNALNYLNIDRLLKMGRKNEFNR